MIKLSVPVPESLVESEIEPLKLSAAVAEAGHGLQVQIAGHEQRGETDLREVGGIVERHVKDLPIRSRQLHALDVRMHAGEQGVGALVSAAGTDVHQLASSERWAAATALTDNAAVRARNTDHAHQLIFAGLPAARRASPSPDQPRKTVAVGALGDRHLLAVHRTSRSPITYQARPAEPLGTP